MSTISDSIRSLTSDELRDRRAELVDEARTLVRSDVDLTGDDAERFDALTAEIDDIDKLIARHDEIARLAGLGNVTMGDGAAASAPALHRNRDPWAERATTPHDARELALRAIDATSAPDHAKATASALARTEGLAARWARATSNPHYLTAFHKLWNDPARGHLEWSTAERGAHVAVAELQRSMSLTGTAGGYLVPFTLDPSILLTGDGSTNPMRQIARVVQTATNQWSGVSSAGVTASWDAEGAQVSDDTPTLAQPAIDTHKGAAFIPFSIEVGMDAPGFATECAKLLVDAKDQLEATTFVTGNGTTAPKGLVTALDGTASEVAPTTAETFAVADVYKLIEALPARFQPGARWQAALAVINKMRQFATGTGPQSAFVADLTAGQPPQILGKPLHENSNMDGTWDTAATADNFVLLVGDHQHYVIVDRIGTTIELVPHLFGANGRPTGERGYYAYFRTGADVSTINAFRVLNLATTA